MSKKSLIERERKRINLFSKYSLLHDDLRKKFKNTNDTSEKLEIYMNLQKLPRNSFKTRICNRCWKTGRSRGVIRDFGLSRHVFREMAHQCLLPGITKSSW